MPPKADTDPPPGISDDSISLLLAVCKRAQSAFTFGEWREISGKAGESPEAK
jgi:hypothetical protein